MEKSKDVEVEFEDNQQNEQEIEKNDVNQLRSKRPVKLMSDVIKAQLTPKSKKILSL